jgi:hypothetical protein
MRHRMMALAGLAIALLALVLPASSVAAKPVIQEHSNFSDTFPSNFCGIEGTSVVKGVESFTLYADGTFRDTSTSGRSSRPPEAGSQCSFRRPSR